MASRWLHQNPVSRALRNAETCSVDVDCVDVDCDDVHCDRAHCGDVHCGDVHCGDVHCVFTLYSSHVKSVARRKFSMLVYE